MITQNTIALTIVFLAAAITIYSIAKSLFSKKASKCDGCAGCAFKNQVSAKNCGTVPKNDFNTMRIARLSNKQFHNRPNNKHLSTDSFALLYYAQNNNKKEA